MNRGQWIGIGLSIAGFCLAIIAGLILATQVSTEELDTNGLLGGAALAFIPVAILVGTGIYLYVRQLPSEVGSTYSIAQKQRELMDILRSRGQIALVDAALELGVTDAQLKEMIDDLIGLEIFNASVDWETGILYSSDADQLLEG